MDFFKSKLQELQKAMLLEWQIRCMTTSEVSEYLEELEKYYYTIASITGRPQILKKE